MPMHPVFRSFAAVSVVALSIAGCGGGSDPKAKEKANTPSSSTATDDSQTDVDLPDAVGLADEKCRDLADAFDQSALSDSLTTGDDPTEELQRAADALEQASEDVPAEIKADVEVMAEAYADLAERSADVDWAGLKSGNPAAAAGAAQLGQAFSSGDFVTAAQNLTAYVTEHCTG